ncbi:hypothetical protein [Bacillus coahuilensis]|uniref:hypothetical protein n=1 Tax=Bacillus coahuilensis TaxID=408580 RepID=UPI000B32A092|nr:hypothetical protein [Bacillus coahuilensis]
MSNSMLSFYFLQFMVSLITTISASFLAFSMISPIQSKGATSSAPSLKSLYLAVFLTFNWSLTLYLLVPSITISRLCISFFVIGMTFFLL